MEDGQKKQARAAASRIFDTAMERIRATTGLRTQVELAAALDIRQSSISDARRRDSIPDSWLVKLLLDYGLSPLWIESGQGAVYLKDDPDRIGPAHLRPAQPAKAPEPTVAELVERVEAGLGGVYTVALVPAGHGISYWPVKDGVEEATSQARQARLPDAVARAVQA